MVTKISAIIEAYLQRENRLIIPNVGTLLKRKESGEIVFVEMLKKNDGKLEALVAAQFGVTAEEAAAIVEGYVEEIGRQITASRKFIIDGVGVLLVGANGALDFAFNPFSHTIPEPEAKAAEPEVKTVEPEVKAAEPKVIVEQFEDEEEEEEEEVKVEEPKVVAPEPTKPVAPQVKSTVSATARKQSALYDDDDEEDAPKEAPRKINIRRPASRKKVDPITIIAIVAVVLAMITLLWGAFSNNSDELELDATEQYEMGSDFLLEEN